jgi:hypothetical protein
MEILNYGIAGPNLAGQICADPTPNAILRIERLRDNQINGANGGGCNYAGSTVATDYWPNALFDTREALVRDPDPGGGAGNLRLGGVMHYISLDTRNLTRWLNGLVAPYTPALGGTGTLALNNNGTGYVVYFSDRRNNRDAANLETGEFGFEDIVNRASQVGVADNALEPAVPPAITSPEDVNANGALDTYGRCPAFAGVQSCAANLVPGATAPLDFNARPSTALSRGQAQVNRAVLFRRALKLINGGLVGDIVAPGLSVVSENPVYMQGDWNARAAGMNAAWNQPHVATSVIADAVTFLSNNWNDTTYSFANPYNPGARPRAVTYYRVALIAGKHPSFQLPAWGPVASDFGTDGGVHNFLRFLESGSTLNYKGSLASFYYSRQALGIYKCCATVYGPPTRAYSFDIDFLNPALLPPLTPVFRDLNTLGFSQETRPGM